MARLEPGEEAAEGQDKDQADRVRRVLADVYTFVRSRELNKSLSGYTFDHYLEEAKLRIKGDGRAIRDASGEAFDIRPSQLESLDSLEEEFTSNLSIMEELAAQAEDNDG